MSKIILSKSIQNGIPNAVKSRPENDKNYQNLVK